MTKHVAAAAAAATEAVVLFATSVFMSYSFKNKLVKVSESFDIVCIEIQDHF